MSIGSIAHSPAQQPIQPPKADPDHDGDAAKGATAKTVPAAPAQNLPLPANPGKGRNLNTAA
jgi:hypothetical protein